MPGLGCGPPRRPQGSLWNCARAWAPAAAQSLLQPLRLDASRASSDARTWGTVVPGVLAGSDEDMDDVLAMLATALLVSGLAHWGRAAAELHTNVRDDSMKPVFGTGSLPVEYPYEVLKLLTWVRIPESPAGHVTRFRVGMTIEVQGTKLPQGVAGTSVGMCWRLVQCAEAAEELSHQTRRIAGRTPAFGFLLSLGW